MSESLNSHYMVRSYYYCFFFCICASHLPVREALGRPVWGRRSCLGCRSHGGRGQGAKYPKADQRRRTRGRWRPTLRKQKEANRPIWSHKKMDFHTSLVEFWVTKCTPLTGSVPWPHGSREYGNVAVAPCRLLLDRWLQIIFSNMCVLKYEFAARQMRIYCTVFDLQPRAPTRQHPH